jgi:hypothetical protein
MDESVQAGTITIRIALAEPSDEERDEGGQAADALASLDEDTIADGIRSAMASAMQVPIDELYRVIVDAQIDN